MMIQGEYTKTTIFLLFFLFSNVGWIWEVVYTSSWHGFFVNRGFMHGPWLPIYGLGAVLMLLFLNRIRSRLWLVFLMSAGIGGVLEYGASLVMEYVFHTRWWDYSDLRFHFQGRTCLLVILIFGILGVTLVSFLGPVLSNWIMLLPVGVQEKIVWLLGVLFLVDYVCSLIWPNVGAGVTCS